MRFGFKRGSWAGRPGRQRGIFDFGFSAEESNIEKLETTDLDREVREESRAEQRQTEEQRETTETTTTQLPEEVQRVLTSLITSLGGAGAQTGTGAGLESSGELAQLGRDLVARAEAAEGLLRHETQAIVGGARTTAERDLARRTTELAASVGSTQNSFVQQAATEGRVQLESSLAALESQLNINARNVATNEFKAAMSALTGAAASAGTSSQGLAQLVQALRGATVTTTGQAVTERAGESITESNRSLDEIVRAITDSSGSTESGGFKFAFGL